MSDRRVTFGIGLGEALAAGVRGYLANLWPLSVAGAATLGTYVAFRLPAQAAADSGFVARSLVLDLAGLIVAAVVAHPWFSYALDADRGMGIDLLKPFNRPAGFMVQAVASIWFWAAMVFGLRYLYGIPSILALLFYAFYGFVVADRRATSGLKALGTSARIGEGRRVGLFGIAAVLTVLNLFGAVAVGFGVNPGTLALTVLGLVVTTNVSLVTGARIYRTLENETE